MKTKSLYSAICLTLILGTSLICRASTVPYSWITPSGRTEPIEKRVSVPRGYKRIHADAGSFAYWLRHLPLKPDNTPVMLFNGRKKGNQNAHHAVIDIDVGARDLQQCADAVMRLRAEYLYGKGEVNRIRFNFTSGHPASFSAWKKGMRPRIKGNRVEWRKSARPDGSYKAFRKYLKTVFMYAGTWSLSRELIPVPVSEMQIGDVFIQGGFPGHAVIVADMAEQEATRDRIFLLVQSYMPAQDMHVLRNPDNRGLSPWYGSDFGGILRTPEWTFESEQLKRFP